MGSFAGRFLQDSTYGACAQPQPQPITQHGLSELAVWSICCDPSAVILLQLGLPVSQASLTGENEVGRSIGRRGFAYHARSNQMSLHMQEP